MSEETFMSPLASQVQRFLQFKRAVGCRYEAEEGQLRIMDRFLASHLNPRDPVITDDIIRTYVTLTGKNAVTRLTVLRQFCRFIVLEEPRTFIPPRGFLGIRKTPFVPHILTRNEGRKFVKACFSFRLLPRRRAPLRAMLHGTMLLLLYLAGLRVGEVLSLRLEDVDLANGVIRVQRGKFGKSRLVPLARDLTDLLEQCRTFVDRSLGVRPPDAYFFPGPTGSPYHRVALWKSFKKVLAEANIPYAGAGRRLRLHDLRHAYAVHRMMLWCEQGADLGAQLPVLATYMGHVGLSSSQYYLRLTEDVLEQVVNRYQSRFGHLIEERRAK
jgi:integrase